MSSKQDPEREPDAQDTDCEGRNKNREENSASTPIILAKNVTIGTITEAKSGARDDLGSSTQKIGDHGDRPYMYRDFSQIPEEEFDMDYEVDQEGLLQALEESTALAAAQAMQQTAAQSSFMLPDPTRNIMRASGWVRSQRFPVKLYALLNQPNLSPVITWMPHGRSWKVLKPRIFETTVLPVFFESDNYHSFNRVINAWSFRRKSTGADRGSYFHELFLRGKPHIQKFMRRLPRSHKKLNMTKEEEPDFFELAKTSPLPSLEEAKSTVELRKVQRFRNQLQQEAIQGSAPSNIFGLPTLADGRGLQPVLPPHFFPPPSGEFQPRGPL